MKLRTKTNIGILLVFCILAISTGIVTFRWHTSHAIKGAENRVRLYIKAAWEIYNSKTERIQFALLVLAEDDKLKNFMLDRRNADLRAIVLEQLERVRREQNMDILNLIDTKGRVVLRTRNAGTRGDDVSNDPMIRLVLKDRKRSGGTVLFDNGRLKTEGEDLVRLARLYGGEPAAMMTGAAVPVKHNGRLIGVIQMGNLLNGSVEKVDRIRDSVFENQRYNGKPVGTATVFMRDLRISTNVLNQDGTRATGTRASGEVAERVLKNGRSWTGRAWVVNAWYLSQYDPIRDPDGRVIGMLYIGSLEQRYLDERSRAVLLNLGVVFGGMLLAVVVFYPIIRTILSPVHRLYQATRRLSAGDLTHRIDVRSNDEIGELSDSFNHMAEQLLKDQQEIQESHAQLEERNEELHNTNRNYMEMLGFVSHEFKAPLGSAILGLYSVKDGYLGPVSESQARVLGSVAHSLDYLNDMVKHYLDLSRLEKGELTPHRRRVRIKAEVVEPILSGLGPAVAEKQMVVTSCLADDLTADADPSLLRIVYENLLSNAVRYGREGGSIQLAGEQTNGTVKLVVYNDGDGVPADKINRLFKKFSRIDNIRNAREKGTELGLFICKEIIDQHGGSINAESKEGEWTRFTFTLPAEASVGQPLQKVQ